jgi:adenine/guanine/hypoxanthine permease
VVAGNSETLVTLGHLHAAAPLLSCIGFLLIAGLAARGVPGAILIGILLTTALGWPFGLTAFHGIIAAPPSLARRASLSSISPMRCHSAFPLWC